MAEDPKPTLLGKNVPKQVPRKRLPSKVEFLGTACNYNSQKRFPSKVPGTVSKQGSKQEQGSQEQVLKQAFPGRTGSQAKIPGTTGNPCLRTSSWEPCLRNSSWQPCLRSCSWEPFPGTLLVNLFLGNMFRNLFLGTLLGNLFLGTLLGTCLGILLVNLFLGTLYGHLFLGTCGWEPCLGTSS